MIFCKISQIRIFEQTDHEVTHLSFLLCRSADDLEDLDREGEERLDRSRDRDRDLPLRKKDTILFIS